MTIYDIKMIIFIFIEKLCFKHIVQSIVVQDCESLLHSIEFQLDGDDILFLFLDLVIDF